MEACLKPGSTKGHLTQREVFKPESAGFLTCLLDVVTGLEPESTVMGLLPQSTGAGMVLGQTCSLGPCMSPRSLRGTLKPKSPGVDLELQFT